MIDYAVNEKMRDKILLFLGKEDMTMTELARQAELNVSTVYEIVRGKSSGTRVSTLLNLCEAMGTDPNTMLDWKER